MSVALRACDVRAVPWAGLLQAILEGRLQVFAIKSGKTRRSLAHRVAVRDGVDLASLIAREVSGKPTMTLDWIDNATASEILGINGTVVWMLTKAGALKKHREAPQHLHFKRSDVERFNGQMIFTPEIVKAGQFQTYRKASAWLRERNIEARFELKRGGWKVYSRPEVEAELKRRIGEMPPLPTPPGRSKGQWHGPDSVDGKLAAARELSDASRIGYGTAATILGATIFAVQKLADKGLLTASDKVTPFFRAEVETLAKRFIFIPEIKRITGYKTFKSVTNSLNNAGIGPLFSLRADGVPVFDRARVEKHIARAEFLRGSHAPWIKRKLLAMVERGNSVHRAAIACGVSYPTAKKWASKRAERKLDMV